MKKNIASELAVGIVLLVAILVGGIFLMQQKKWELEDQYSLQTIQMANKDITSTKIGSYLADRKNQQQGEISMSCKPHYYEGEAQVHGWLASGSYLDSQLNVQIKNEDIEKLPTTRADSLNAHFAAILIDPTDQVRNDLKNASQGNPAMITVHGFARICQDSPEVSLSQASIAFKKG